MFMANMLFALTFKFIYQIGSKGSKVRGIPYTSNAILKCPSQNSLKEIQYKYTGTADKFQLTQLVA